jgi:hypothetical protein
LTAGNQFPRQAGSWKNKITATELLEERANCDFDQKDLLQGVLGKEW